jgi:hypothetical protein
MNTDLEMHIETVKPFVEGIAEGLFSKEPLDHIDFINCIEELLAYHGVEMPDGELTIKPVMYRGYKREQG